MKAYRFHARVVFCSALFLFFVFFTSQPVQAQDAGAEGWVHFETTPNIDSAGNPWYPSLTGIWGTSNTYLFAVGSGLDFTDPPQNDDDWMDVMYTVVYKFDGHELTEVGFPRLNGMVDAIWGFAENDIFVGGGYAKGYTYPIMYHYDGGSWTKMDVPVDVSLTPLRTIWGAANNDVWATGQTQGGYVLHYDGSTWETVIIPSTVGGPTDFNGIWGPAANDVYMVADVSDGGLICHYDGTSWSEMKRIPGIALKHVWGTSANNIYAVGGVRDAGGNLVEPVIYHYDGSNWTTVSLPDSSIAVLWGVWGSSENDIYAVGEGGYFHYEGSEWTPYEGLNESGNFVWCLNEDHVFKSSWQLSKRGRRTTSTTDILVQITTGTGTVETFIPIDPDTIDDDTNRPSSLPLGLFDFTVPVPAGEKATFRVEVPGTLDVNQWWKHSDDTGWYRQDNARFEVIQDDVGNKYTIIIFSVTDNQAGDNDPRPGYIRDPSGPGNPGTGGGAGGGGGGGGCFVLSAK